MSSENLSQAELRKFGLILAGGFIGFFGLLIPLLQGKGVHLTSWPWLTAVGLALISLAYPEALGLLSRIWMFLGHILGWINTRIILSLVFLLMFFPAALVFKLLGKDPMQRNLDAGLKSYRVSGRQPKTENLNRLY
ncbi:SxtJ family membrane protein [Candidatus Electronema sp. TJ]|uniref:SxtJ family membrane protein n=1 Tax=Candidatus Electronema sp. TJ TaxID=3401573 RepID=UPI003AA83589